MRYVRYMGDSIHGDMGTYGAARNSVAKRISTALPVTMQLTFIGLAIGAVVSFCSASSRHCIATNGRIVDPRLFHRRLWQPPSFWLAVLSILLFSSPLKVLPGIGCSCLTSPRIRLAIWDV